MISWSDVTGGTSGMVTLPTLKIGDYRLSNDGRIGYYYVGLGLLFLNIAFLYLLTRSRLGRAIMALRDNKYYAIARGVSETELRHMALDARETLVGQGLGEVAAGRTSLAETLRVVGDVA